MTTPRSLTPTALVAFTECAHSTALDLACDARGEPRPKPSGAFFDLIAGKGREHEEAYLARLRAAGVEVMEIPSMRDGVDAAAEATLDAMHRGDQVIAQACLLLDGWRGAADFLERVDEPSDLGAWSYEPVDAKLTRHEALPHHVLQLAVYADAVASVQGRLPDAVHVELGSGRRASVPTAEVIHYARHQRRRMEAFVAAPAETVAYPNRHCRICQHAATCTAEWRAGDHPSFVPLIRRDHVMALRAADPPVTTLSDLAAVPAGTAVPGIKDPTLAEVRSQAQLQVRTREEGVIAWEHREREIGRGFELLLDPAPGDIYLDLEGDPVWRPDRGLVFLFGWIEREGDEWVYQALWSHDPDAEAARGRELVRFVRERRAADPAMRVYHYSHAETSMLGAIAAVDPADEASLALLVDEGAFVDLYKVVRQGLRIGLESYGLKHVERLARFERMADVDGGSDAVILYERWLADDSSDDALLERIAAYNEEDCRATLAVADWLRANRPTGPIAEEEPWEKSPEAIERDRLFDEREALAEAICAAHPDDPGARLVAALLNYFEREDRVRRREVVELHQLPTRERLEDSRILTGLLPIGTAVPGPKATVDYAFPEQDHKVGEGNAQDIDADGRYVTVVAVDERERRITLRFRAGDTSPDHPQTLIPSARFLPLEKQDALDELGSAALAGARSAHPLAFAIADRDLPRTGDSETADPDRAGAGGTSDVVDDVCRRALALEGGPLIVQGPPGTGKTWLAGRIVEHLTRAGHTVALTAPSHAAIVKACEEIEDAMGASLEGRAVRYASRDRHVGLRWIAENDKTANAAGALAGGAVLIAGTSWLCARADLRGAVDYLIVDEAGQFGVCDAIAAATCARKGVILLGDPLQLPQVSQARHEEGAGRSVLEHILGDETIVPPERGVLLEESRRMHPDVCRFISDHVYEGRLTSLPACSTQQTAEGTGIRTVAVTHEGRSAKSPEEAEAVHAVATRLIGTPWTDKDGTTRPLGVGDIMVVAPYNSHVRRVLDELHADPRTSGIRVGTVDRFQGGEAPVVIYTTATSSEDDLPRDREFLFSRNRLNVAISRAQGLAYIVSNPCLLDTRATTVEQMKLLSTLCAAWVDHPFAVDTSSRT